MCWEDASRWRVTSARGRPSPSCALDASCSSGLASPPRITSFRVLGRGSRPDTHSGTTHQPLASLCRRPSSSLLYHVEEKVTISACPEVCVGGGGGGEFCPGLWEGAFGGLHSTPRSSWLEGNFKGKQKGSGSGLTADGEKQGFLHTAGSLDPAGGAPRGGGLA